MHLIGLSVILQIICAVHCVRNGRNGLWLMVILFFSVLGCAAYAWFEILPGYMGRREVRRVKAAAVKVLDPDRGVRQAREALETSETPANRIALGDALAEQGKWSEAISHYQVADRRSVLPDRSIRFRLARASFEAGRNADARALTEGLPPTSSSSDNDRAALLMARILEQDGESDRALALYADAGARLPGGEAQCRQAALLLSLGRRRDAVPALVEVEKRLKRLDSAERASNAEMYDWASRTLAELRASGA